MLCQSVFSVLGYLYVYSWIYMFPIISLFSFSLSLYLSFYYLVVKSIQNHPKLWIVNVFLTQNAHSWWPILAGLLGGLKSLFLCVFPAGARHVFDLWPSFYSLSGSGLQRQYWPSLRPDNISSTPQSQRGGGVDQREGEMDSLDVEVFLMLIQW